MLGSFATASRRTPPVHNDDDDDNNDNVWQRGKLWPHRMGPIINDRVNYYIINSTDTLRVTFQGELYSVFSPIQTH